MHKFNAPYILSMGTNKRCALTRKLATVKKPLTFISRNLAPHTINSLVYSDYHFDTILRFVHYGKTMSYLLFITTSLAFTCLPGPNALLIVSTSARHGTLREKVLKKNIKESLYAKVDFTSGKLSRQKSSMLNKANSSQYLDANAAIKKRRN